jgi:hypothetical protein
VLGPKHPDTLTSMANLASTYWNQGRWKKAKELEVQVMETFKQVLGPEHPDTLTSMSNLAFTLRSLGEIHAALQMMAQCAKLRSQILGLDHPLTLSSVSTLKKWHDSFETSPFKPAKPSIVTLLEQDIEPMIRISSLGSLSKQQILISLFIVALGLVYVLHRG